MRHTKTPSVDFILLYSRFEVVHMDIVGPLAVQPKTSSDFTIPPSYVVTFIDRATSCQEATPVSSITAQNIAQVFLESWVSRFSVPLHLVANNLKRNFFTNYLLLSVFIGLTSYNLWAYGKI